MNISPTDCPYYLVSRATLVVTSALRRELAAAGVDCVKPAYLGVLMCLWQEDGLRSVELARRAGLEPSTMTSLLDRMQRDELVVRRPDPDDRRAHSIELTDRGRRMKGPVGEVLDRALDTLMRGISAADQSQLKETLRHVLTNANTLEAS